MGSYVDKFLIPKELKKTTKFTEEDKEKVRNLYTQGWAKRAIAREIPMSRRMVDFIINPDRWEKCKKQFAARQKTGVYRYTTKEQSAMVAKVRKRKKIIINQLIPNEKNTHINNLNINN